MSSIAICNWLKTSVPGIIVLGALGSILAFYILQVVGKVFRVAIAQYFQYRLRRYKADWSKGYILGFFDGGKDVYAFLIFLVYRLIIVFVALTGFSVFFFLTLHLIGHSPNGIMLTTPIFFSILFSILFLYLFSQEFLFFKSIYLLKVSPHLPLAHQELSKHINEISGPAAGKAIQQEKSNGG